MGKAVATKGRKMYKQLPVYTDALGKYIASIEKAIEDRFEVIATELMNGTPPIPFSLPDLLKAHHSAGTSKTVYCALVWMSRDLQHTNVSMRLIERSVDEYVNIPTRRSTTPGNMKKGQELILFNEKMATYSDNIADYFEAHDIKVPYLKRLNKTSHRVTCGIALIYCGRKLKASTDELLSAN